MEDPDCRFAQDLSYIANAGGAKHAFSPSIPDQSMDSYFRQFAEFVGRVLNEYHGCCTLGLLMLIAKELK